MAGGSDAITFTTLAERPELRGLFDQLNDASWPRFITKGHNASGIGPSWMALFDRFAAFQIMALDQQGHLAAMAMSMPLVWDGSIAALPAGWDDMMRRGLADAMAGRTADTLSAVAVMVAATWRGHALSMRMIGQLKGLAQERGLARMIAPVRPTLKCKYPLVSMEEYLTWATNEGAPFDPWVRTHWRLGARVLGIAEASMTFIGTVREWEQWTGVPMPASGRYAIEGGLSPVVIDRESDGGTYVEPNVWMQHDLA
jgi:hypothetical protein